MLPLGMTPSRLLGEKGHLSKSGAVGRGADDPLRQTSNRGGRALFPLWPVRTSGVI